MKNFYRHDAGTLIYCAESNLSTSSYELGNAHFIVKGVEIISPYKEKFSSYNQNIIRDELYKMISKRNAASLEEQGGNILRSRVYDRRAYSKLFCLLLNISQRHTS